MQSWQKHFSKAPTQASVVLYCNFRSLAFLGLIGFLNQAAKNFIYSYPTKCSQEAVLQPCDEMSADGSFQSCVQA